MTKTPSPNPHEDQPAPATDPMPVAVRLFNDVTRVFEAGVVDISEVLTIADTATLLPRAAKSVADGLLAYRVGLGPGKWVYVDAAEIQKVRDAVPNKP